MGIINTGTVGTALQIISNVIIPLISKKGIGDVSNTGNLDFRPANWIFSIWGVIYTSVLVGFGLDKGKSLQGMNEKIAYVIASLSNPAWLLIFTSELDNKFILAFATLFILSISLLYILVNGKFEDEYKFSLIEYALSLYTIWAFSATGLNLSYIIQNKKTGSTAFTVWSILLQLLWQLYIIKKTNKATNTLAIPIVGILVSIAIYTRNTVKNKKALIILGSSIIALINQVRVIVNNNREKN
jgi:hypothetical protein